MFIVIYVGNMGEEGGGAPYLLQLYSAWVDLNLNCSKWHRLVSLNLTAAVWIFIYTGVRWRPNYHPQSQVSIGTVKDIYVNEMDSVICEVDISLGYTLKIVAITGEGECLLWFHFVMTQRSLDRCGPTLEQGRFQLSSESRCGSAWRPRVKISKEDWRMQRWPYLQRLWVKKIVARFLSLIDFQFYFALVEITGIITTNNNVWVVFSTSSLLTTFYC